VYQPRNKTLKTFLNVFVHFICELRFGNNITKVAKQEDIKIQNTCFFFKVQQVTQDLSEGVLMGLLNTLAIK